MKRMLSRFLLLLLSLCCFSSNASLAEIAADPILTVCLNDGADIPFMSGFQSTFITNPESLKGITGTACFDFEAYGRTIHMENIALTDDLLLLFFRQESKQPIQYDSSLQFSADWEVMPYLPIWLNGKHLPSMACIAREGHPIDDRTLSCMVALSLESPISDGSVLTFAPDFDDAANAYAGGIAVKLDISRRQDSTVAYAPMGEVVCFLEHEHNAVTDYDFVIERIAFTPFGGRVLLNFRETNDYNGFLNCPVVDANGDVMTTFAATQSFRDDASAEHPFWVRNEIWFFCDRVDEALSLVPLQSTNDPGVFDYTQTAVPLSTLPADVTLKNGQTVRIENLELAEDGFYLMYSQRNFTNYLSFDLADAEGQALGFDFTSCASYTHDHVQGLLGFGAYWTQEYKGQIVPTITPDEIQKVKTLLIGYQASGTRMMTEAAIPLLKEENQ